MFICEKDEYGWTMYLPEDYVVSRTVKALETRGYVVIEPQAVLVVREQIQAYYE